MVAAMLLAVLLSAFGPVSGNAQQDTPSTVHVVQAGETLSEIAEKYDVAAADILELNGIDDANAIRDGQKLRIPLTAFDAAAPAPPGMHRIQPGETLSAIAKRYAVDLDVLMAINGIDNPDAVYSSQLLAIPVDSTSAPAPVVEVATPRASSESTAVPTTPMALPSFHIVQPGDTLTGIARQYGVPADRLRVLNNIGDADFILVGQKLTIGAAAAELTPEAEPTLDAVSTADAVSTPAAVPVSTDAEVATATASIPLPSPPESTTVQVGETLSGIAKRYGLALGDLKALNGIEDANAIYSGQVLRLVAATPTPVVDATAVDTPEDGPTVDTPEDGPAVETADMLVGTPGPTVRSGSPIASLNQTYTVRSGDHLNRIALRLGIDPDALLRINGFADLGEPLATGQMLLLPATGDELRPRIPAQEYVVRPGESLGAIAQQFTLAIGDLLAANRIADPNSIYPGQRLIIPTRALTAAGGSGNQIGPERSGYFYYFVQPGDTLSAIAKQFGSTMQALQAYNDLPNTETVYTGLEIKIPYGAPDIKLERPPVPFSGTRFIVSISRQQCWVYQGDRVMYAWPCSTGAGERKTKAGNYSVQSKIANAKSNIFRLDMPYWLGIYDVGPYENGVHGLPMDWDTGRKIWSGLIGQPATFGCAMLGDRDAATLFRLAFLGMPVHVVN